MPTPAKLQESVERELRCKARLIATEPVTEQFAARAPWTGVVHHFALEGHPTAELAYAWSSIVAGSAQRRHVVVLRSNTVVSARDAVRRMAPAEYDLPLPLTTS